MKTRISIITISVIIIGVLFMRYHAASKTVVRQEVEQQEASVKPEPKQTAPVATVTTPKPTTSTTTITSGYTAADVARHGTSQSCWTSINGGVYDLTSWISRHPGGSEAILGLCGTDGTVAFEDMHGGQGRPETVLASFKIGVLKK